MGKKKCSHKKTGSKALSSIDKQAKAWAKTFKSGKGNFGSKFYKV